MENFHNPIFCIVNEYVYLESACLTQTKKVKKEQVKREQMKNMVA